MLIGSWAMLSPPRVVISLSDGRMLCRGLVWSTQGRCTWARVQLLKGEAENLP